MKFEDILEDSHIDSKWFCNGFSFNIDYSFNSYNNTNRFLAVSKLTSSMFTLKKQQKTTNKIK